MTEELEEEELSDRTALEEHFLSPDNAVALREAAVEEAANSRALALVHAIAVPKEKKSDSKTKASDVHKGSKSKGSFKDRISRKLGLSKKEKLKEKEDEVNPRTSL
jgi:hypothetical protein